MELGLRSNCGIAKGERWIADAHRDNGKRFVVHADEKLTAFLELESAIRPAAATRLAAFGYRSCFGLTLSYFVRSRERHGHL
jgi:hypothetical protein